MKVLSSLILFALVNVLIYFIISAQSFQVSSYQDIIKRSVQLIETQDSTILQQTYQIHELQTYISQLSKKDTLAPAQAAALADSTFYVVDEQLQKRVRSKRARRF